MSSRRGSGRRGDSIHAAIRRGAKKVPTQPPRESTLIKAWLDGVGIPFRESLGDLVAAFGLRNDAQRHQWPVCELLTRSGKPLLTEIIKPFGFHVTDYTSPRDVLDYFYAQIDCGTPKRSFQHAQDALVRALGAGTRTEEFVHTWSAGGDSVTLEAWPNADRSRTTSGKPYENWAQVEIHLDVRWPVAPSEVIDLQSWTALEDMTFGLNTCFAPPDIRRSWDAHVYGQRSGFGMCGTSKSFAGFDADGAVIISRSDLRQVSYELAHPFRAGGFEAIGLHYETTGFSGPVARELKFSSAYENGAQRSSAERLAQAFGLVFEASEYLND
jgi:hypothetical protein